MPVVPEEADEEVERALPTLERPEPRKEDLRGPDRPLGPGVPGEMIDDGLPVDTVPPGVAPGDAPSPLEVPGEAFDQPRGIQPQRQPEAPQPQQELFPPEGAQQQLEEFDQPQGQQPQGQQPEEQKMPEVDDLFPDFGLNDGMQLLPQVEDAPPLLPAGLRAAVAQRRSSLAEPPVIAQPATTTEVQAGPASIAAGPSGMPSTPAVVAAAWAEEGEISLVNPAARGVSADADESLEQAIYYEASDMQPSR